MGEVEGDYVSLEWAKARVFVRHIEKHLKQKGINGKVCCKICGKNIDQIFEEEGSEKNEEG